MNEFEQAANEIEKDYQGPDGENVLEWLKGMKTATISLTDQKMITRVRKLIAKYPGEAEMGADYGTQIVAHIPIKWIHIQKYETHAPEMTEERREAARMRMKALRAKQLSEKAQKQAEAKEGESV